MLDVTDRLVVIVGGGPVAARKARGVLDAGATRVRCVSPAFDAAMPDAVERVEETYEPRHLDGAGLVFAATDLPAVNDAVVRDARARGALVSRADADEDVLDDFTVPAVWRNGPFTVAVSAGGNPALAALVRDGLAQKWSPQWTVLAEVGNWLRPKLRTVTALEPEVRRAVMRDLASDEAVRVLRDGHEVQGLMKWLHDRHPELKGLGADG
jgi:siroheme synthase-like protein